MLDLTPFKKKKVNPLKGAVERRIRTRQARFRQASDSGELNDAVYGSDDEPDITKKRKGLGY